METVEQLETEPAPRVFTAEEVRPLVEALKCLYSETSDYITINNLGDVYHNRSMQLSRDALAHARKIGMEGA